MRAISIALFLSASFSYAGIDDVTESKSKVLSQKLWHHDDPIVYLYWLLGRDEMWYLRDSNDFAGPGVFIGAIKECRSRLLDTSIEGEAFHTGIRACMQEIGFELQNIR